MTSSGQALVPTTTTVTHRWSLELEEDPQGAGQALHAQDIVAVGRHVDLVDHSRGLALRRLAPLADPVGGRGVMSTGTCRRGLQCVYRTSLSV
jgi:hypothetical protein